MEQGSFATCERPMMIGEGVGRRTSREAGEYPRTSILCTCSGEAVGGSSGSRLGPEFWSLRMTAIGLGCGCSLAHRGTFTMFGGATSCLSNSQGIYHLHTNRDFRGLGPFAFQRCGHSLVMQELQYRIQGISQSFVQHPIAFAQLFSESSDLTDEFCKLNIALLFWTLFNEILSSIHVFYF